MNLLVAVATGLGQPWRQGWNLEQELQPGVKKTQVSSMVGKVPKDQVMQRQGDSLKPGEQDEGGTECGPHHLLGHVFPGLCPGLWAPTPGSLLHPGPSTRLGTEQVLSQHLLNE